MKTSFLNCNYIRFLSLLSSFTFFIRLTVAEINSNASTNFEDHEVIDDYDALLDSFNEQEPQFIINSNNNNSSSNDKKVPTTTTVDMTFRSEQMHQDVTLMEGFSPAQVFTFILGPSYEECFYLDIKQAPRMIRFAFFVSSGGSLKIDMKTSVSSINSPATADVVDEDDKMETVVHQVFSQSEHSIALEAKQNGRYSFCFRNKYNEKVVTFALDTTNVGTDSTDSKRTYSTDGKFSELKKSMKELRVLLSGLETEQDFLKDKKSRHLFVQDSTEWKITWYTIFESIFVFVIAIFQLKYVQNLLNRRVWV